MLQNRQILSRGKFESIMEIWYRLNFPLEPSISLLTKHSPQFLISLLNILLKIKNASL